MPAFSEADFNAIILTLKLASFATLILLIIGTPIAWWLARSNSRLKPVVSAIVTLPLILPSSVLGFYLLIAMGPEGPIGSLTRLIGISNLAFTFEGLVLASVIYSLPFVVQPIQGAFISIGARPIEVAATLRAGPIDTFFSVIIPLAKPGFISASVLGFAHTVGEFGIVLMIGGNIPGETQVVSVQLYNHVEALQYENAHTLALTLILFSFLSLIGLYGFNREQTSVFALRR